MLLVSFYNNYIIELHYATSDHCFLSCLKNVIPDPSKSCGPYKAQAAMNQNKRVSHLNTRSHDTIGRFYPISFLLAWNISPLSLFVFIQDNIFINITVPARVFGTIIFP